MITHDDLIKNLKDEDYARENKLPHIRIDLYGDGWAYIEVKTNTVGEKVMKKVWEDPAVQSNLKIFKNSRERKQRIDSHYGYKVTKEVIYVDCRTGDVHYMAMKILDLYIDYIEKYKES